MRPTTLDLQAEAITHLEMVNPRYAEVWRLRDQGLTQEQSAERIGITVNNLAQRKKRGRRRVRKDLGGRHADALIGFVHPTGSRKPLMAPSPLVARCSCCGDVKLKSDFTQRPERTHTISSECKDCKALRRTTKYAADPEQRARDRVHVHRRRAREASVPSDGWTDADAAVLWDEMGLYGCQACDNPDVHDDHLYPLAEGGHDEVWNIRPLCRTHNSSKGARLDWRPRV